MNAFRRKETIAGNQKALWPQFMAQGMIGFKTTQRYRVKISTLELKTTAERRRIVWHMHTPFTPCESCSKFTKSSMAETTCKGGQDVKSLVASCRITISVWNEWRMCRSNFDRFNDCAPPYCMLSYVSGSRQMESSVQTPGVTSALAMKLCKRGINEWPRIKTRGVPLVDYTRRNSSAIKHKRNQSKMNSRNTARQNN